MKRQLFGTATIANNATLFTKILEIAEQIFQPLKNVTDFQASVVFQPISRSITTKGALNGGNSLGLEGSRDLICKSNKRTHYSGFQALPSNISFHTPQSSTSPSNGPSPMTTAPSTKPQNPSSARPSSSQNPKNSTMSMCT